MSRRRVVVVQRVVPHYRVALYRDLRDALAQHGVDLELVHGGGHADPRKARRHDLATLAWAEVAAVRALRLGPRVLAEWQRSTASVRSADVVVLEQASRLVLNHRLLLSPPGSRSPRVVLWGHGRDHATRRRERLKAAMTRRADAFFAYSASGAEMVSAMGFPPSRTYVVGNGIDVRAERARADAVADSDVGALRSATGIPAGARVAAYVGGFIPPKRMGLLVDAVEVLRDDVDLHLIVAGDGPCRAEVQAWASARPWLHVLRPVFGMEKAVVLAAADVIAIAGWAGLGIVDAMAHGRPLVVGADGPHPPEFEHLVHGENALLAKAMPEALAQQIGRALSPAVAGTLVATGRRSADQFDVTVVAERMAVALVRLLED